MIKFSLNYIEPPHTTAINEYSHVFQFLLKFNLFEYLFLLRKYFWFHSVLLWCTMLCVSSNSNEFPSPQLLSAISLNYPGISICLILSLLSVEIYLIIFFFILCDSLILFVFLSFFYFLWKEILWFGKRKWIQLIDLILLNVWSTLKDLFLWTKSSFRPPFISICYQGWAHLTKT